MDWEEIEEFPGYSVHCSGVVRNDSTDRLLALQRNQHRVINVGLMKGGVQHKRAVALLVAQAFLGPATPVTFDTPIHLDGDLSNCHVDNLMWRPRWFSLHYHKQFGRVRQPAVPKMIQEKHTGERFHNSMHAATTFGLLDREIFQSMVNRTYVWPTYQEFRVVQE